MPKKLAELIQANFPKGMKVPESIRSLCAYLEKHDYPISGTFEINSRKDVAAEWFPGDKTMQRQIAVFGNSSTGSTYALWLTNEKDPEEAPVVLLGSEGDFVVLAMNATEFCRLLGCGYEELEWDDLSGPPALWDETAKLRKWLSAKLDLQCPETGQEIVAPAQNRHNGFADWMRKWQDAHL